MAENLQQTCETNRIAIDIGSTVVKIAEIGSNDELIKQEFHPRDFDTGIAKQVETLLETTDCFENEEKLLICSSANGGLRVGIVCLTNYFSGAAFRDQVFLAGANPVFVYDFECDDSSLKYVDILLVGGGIDCQDSAPMEERIRQFNPQHYRFGSLVYAGNKYLANLFIELFPQSVVIDNPLGNTLRSGNNSVFSTLRRSYLDDLVYKEGVSELGTKLSQAILPTPEIVNRGFQRAVFNHSSILVAGACILIDIGGATTDIDYTVEIIRDDSDDQPSAGASIARYVFTDLGIYASLESTILQIRSHPRLYELLDTVLQEDVREVYRALREGEYDPSPQLLSYACLFLCLDRFSQGQGSGLPVADLSKVAQYIFTGGSSQNLDEEVAARIIALFVAETSSKPGIFIDRNYQVWVDGITWSHTPD